MRIPIALLASLLLLPALAPLPLASAAPAFAYGSDIELWDTLDPAARKAALDASAAGRMGLIVADAKDGWGTVSWATTAAPTVEPFTPGAGGLDRITSEGHAAGLVVSARFDVFQDSEAAKRFPSARVGGTPSWVDPACAGPHAYLVGLVRDLATRVAVDEILLDHVRYPDTDDVSSSAALPCTGGTVGTPSGATRSDVVASFVRDAAAAAHAARPGVRVGVSVYSSAVGAPRHDLGQDISRLAPHVDLVAPMLYPSYESAAAVNDPYSYAKSKTLGTIAAVGAAKTRPWVQGFDAFATTSGVCSQLRGVRDAGAPGAHVWWFTSMGTSTTKWKAVGDCVLPASAPPPTAFSATFGPKGNGWWVETTVKSSVPATRVVAIVNGGAPIDLPATSWGTWAKSFKVAYGSTVRFEAFAADGAKATSGSYAWPPTFPATFEKRAANDWWIEVAVTSKSTIASVRAEMSDGTRVDLAKTSWGTWAKSTRVSDGATVRFVARDPAGRTATSGAYAWP